MNKEKKQSPKSAPVQLDQKSLKEVSGGNYYGNYYGSYTNWNTHPGGIVLN